MINYNTLHVVQIYFIFKMKIKVAISNLLFRYEIKKQKREGS